MSCTGKGDVTLTHTYRRRKINFKSRAYQKNLCFVIIWLKFILNYPDLLVQNAGFGGPWEWKLEMENQICTVQSHPQMCDERQSGNWLYREEAEYTECKEVVPRWKPGGPHKSEVKEGILFHSRLLFVSCLAGRNGRKTGQDHSYQKCFWGESEECYGQLCWRQC